MDKKQINNIVEEAWQAVAEVYVKPKTELEFKLFWSLGSICNESARNEGFDESVFKKIAAKVRKKNEYLIDAMKTVTMFENNQDKMLEHIGTMSLRQFRAKHFPRAPKKKIRCDKCGTMKEVKE